MNLQRASQILGLLLWTQTLFLAGTFRTWWVMIALAALATALVVLRNTLRAEADAPTESSVPRWLRLLSLFTAMATTVILVGYWRTANQIGEDINVVYLGVEILAHAAMVAALILWVLHPNRGHLAMLPLGLIVVLLSVAGGGASVSIAAQTAVALTACLGFAVGSQVILGSPHDRAGGMDGGKRGDDRSKWLGPIFSLLALSILMMGTSAIANATGLVLPTIQNRLQEQLQTSFDAMGEESYVGGTRYVRGGRLGSLRQHMMGDPQEVALQVYCKVPPGYLRGTVFDRYRRGRWLDSGSFEYERFTRKPRIPDTMIPPIGVGTAELKVEVKQPLNRFHLVDQTPLKTIHLEVLTDPSKGSLVFLPLASHWLEAVSQELAVTSHGIVRSGIDVRRPYVVGVGTNLPQVELSPATLETTTEVSTSLQPLIDQYSQQICGQAATASEKASAISQYFQSEYKYSLASIDLPRGVDPLAYFLESKHDAHCEYFASATVLMLRSVGVPARYVTGYVVDEASEEDSELWLARNRDAHAWVEAYDDQSGRWFPVESTPGRTYQTVEPEKQNLIADGSGLNLLDGDDEDRQTLIGRIVGWLGSIRITEPILILFRFAQLPLFLALSFVLWKRYLKPAGHQDDTGDLQSRRMLRQVDRQMRKLSLVRRSSETLYQFADRIEQAAANARQTDLHTTRQTTRPVDLERMDRCASWYRSYADARYQGRLPQAIA